MKKRIDIPLITELLTKDTKEIGHRYPRPAPLGRYTDMTAAVDMDVMVRPDAVHRLEAHVGVAFTVPAGLRHDSATRQHHEQRNRGRLVEFMFMPIYKLARETLWDLADEGINSGPAVDKLNALCGTLSDAFQGHVTGDMSGDMRVTR